MATVDLNDKNLTNITNEKNAVLNSTNAAYDSMINSTDTYYQDQINASKEWANKQSELQQAQSDFTIEKIEQQKKETEQDYTKEQKGAYQDYMKQNNAYGSSKQATGQSGLAGSGWSETVQAGYYNTYQNRYATARETYNKALTNYNLAIKDAQLQNNSNLAQIAYEAQQTQLKLAVENIQYKNQLLQEKTAQQLNIANQYNSQWQTMYNTLLNNAQFEEQEKRAWAQYNESVRQYNETLAFQKAEAAREQANWQKQYNYTVEQNKKAEIEKQQTQQTQQNSKTSSKQTANTVKKALDNAVSLAVGNNSNKTANVANNYNNVLKTARTLYNSAPKNKKQAAETYIATALANKKISKADAEKMVKALGLK